MMEIREVQLRAAYDALYDLRASFDRQIAALRAVVPCRTAASAQWNAAAKTVIQSRAAASAGSLV
jgi:hypothetical protein